MAVTCVCACVLRVCVCVFMRVRVRVRVCECVGGWGTQAKKPKLGNMFEALDGSDDDQDDD